MKTDLLNDDTLEQITNYCMLGATLEEIAVFLDVDVATVYRWKKENLDFCKALKRGQEDADAQVVKSLYKRATKDNDTTAMIWWLKNRRSQNWRDKQHHSHDVEGSLLKMISEDIFGSKDKE